MCINKISVGRGGDTLGNSFTESLGGGVEGKIINRAAMEREIRRKKERKGGRKKEREEERRKGGGRGVFKVGCPTMNQPRQQG
jgi:hypothetical protein